MTKSFSQTIPLLFLIIGFIAHYLIPGELQILSDLILLIAVFTHSYLFWGIRKTFYYIVLAMLIGYIAEFIGINTGWIFGNYHYNESNSFILLGIPLFIPISYGVLLYAGNFLCISISEKLLNKNNLWILALLTGFILTLKDVVTDPLQSTVSQTWIWEDGGPYYGVPLHNFIGWLVVFIIMTYVTLTLTWHHKPYHKKPLTKNDYIFPISLFASLVLFGITAGFVVPENYQDIGTVSSFLGIMIFVPYLLLAWFINFRKN